MFCSAGSGFRHRGRTNHHKPILRFRRTCPPHHYSYWKQPRISLGKLHSFISSVEFSSQFFSENRDRFSKISRRFQYLNWWRYRSSVHWCWSRSSLCTTMRRGVATRSVPLNGYHGPRHVWKTRSRHVCLARHLIVYRLRQWRGKLDVSEILKRCLCLKSTNTMHYTYQYHMYQCIRLRCMIFKT